MALFGPPRERLFLFPFPFLRPFLWLEPCFEDLNVELFLDLRALFLLLWPFLVLPRNFDFSGGARTNYLSSRDSGLGSVNLHLMPTSSWILLYFLFWDLRTRETTVPVRPALAVLPLLCLYALPSSGGS